MDAILPPVATEFIVPFATRECFVHVLTNGQGGTVDHGISRFQQLPAVQIHTKQYQSNANIRMMLLAHCVGNLNHV